MDVKKHSKREANQCCDSPTHQPLESSKSQFSTVDPNNFISFYSTEDEKKRRERATKYEK